jgi:hypothetical protein
MKLIQEHRFQEVTKMNSKFKFAKQIRQKARNLLADGDNQCQSKSHKQSRVQLASRNQQGFYPLQTQNSMAPNK